MYFGIASNDDAQQPEAKDVLRESFADAGVEAEVEVYSGAHGWCVTDMPKYMRAWMSGYCMGGPLIVRTAASLPDRIGAAASFHGGGLVTANANQRLQQPLDDPHQGDLRASTNWRRFIMCGLVTRSTCHHPPGANGP